MEDRVNSIVQLLRSIQSEANSPYNDGWVASDCKRDLIMIRYELDRIIKECPDFGKEEDKWDQEIIIRRLKEK